MIWRSATRSCQADAGRPPKRYLNWRSSGADTTTFRLSWFGPTIWRVATGPGGIRRCRQNLSPEFEAMAGRTLKEIPMHPTKPMGDHRPFGKGVKGQEQSATRRVEIARRYCTSGVRYSIECRPRIPTGSDRDRVRDECDDADGACPLASHYSAATPADLIATSHFLISRWTNFCR